MNRCFRLILCAAMGIAALAPRSELRAQDETWPMLIAWSPEDLAVDVDRLAPIVLTFNEPMRPQGDILVNSVMGPIALNYSWSANGTVLSGTPVAALPANQIIFWTIDTGSFEDLAGNPLEEPEEDIHFYYTGSTIGGGGGNPGGTGTNAFTLFQLGKMAFFEQTNASLPWIDPEIGLVFSASVALASNRTATSVSVSLPNARDSSLIRNPAALELFSFVDFSNEIAGWETAYPPGNHTFTVNASTSNQTYLVNFPAMVQPNAPYLTNFTAAQAINASQPFTLRWEPFLSGTAADHIQVSVGDVLESPDRAQTNALRGTATSFTIPAGTLASGSHYQASISFFRMVATTNGGNVSLVGRTTMTSFEIQTLGTVVTNPPIVLSRPVRTPSGSIQFHLNTEAGRQVRVEYANQLTNWTQLLVTNTPAPSTLITDPNPPDATRIYRARHLP